MILFYSGHLQHEKARLGTIGVARGAIEAMPPQYLENIVILCFERRFFLTK